MQSKKHKKFNLYHGKAIVAISNVAIVIRDGNFQLQHSYDDNVANTLVMVQLLLLILTLATVQLSSQIAMATPPFAAEAVLSSSCRQKSFAVAFHRGKCKFFFGVVMRHWTCDVFSASVPCRHHIGLDRLGEENWVFFFFFLSKKIGYSNPNEKYGYMHADQVASINVITTSTKQILVSCPKKKVSVIKQILVFSIFCMQQSGYKIIL